MSRKKATHLPAPNRNTASVIVYCKFIFKSTINIHQGIIVFAG